MRPLATPTGGSDAPAYGADRQRLRLAMSRWRRRSLVIRFWRLALPTLIALIAAGVGTLIAYNFLFGANRVSDTDQEIRMISPRFLGRDKSDRPFTVTAKEATRDARRPDLIHLDHPRLVLDGPPGGRSTVVQALTGVYNETTHALALDGQVTLDDGKLNVVRSEHAVVDTDKGAAAGQTPVVADGPMGRTTGDAYVVHDRGGRIVVTGHVHTHVVAQ